VYLPRTWTVCPDGSGDFTTIQAAINEAGSGDIIELCDATYTGPGNRDIDYLGKAITVRSASGNPEACIIDCQGAGGAIVFDEVGDESRLEGITITNASGVAVECWNSGPTFVDCVFSENPAGVVWLFQSFFPPATFTNCAFLDNAGLVVDAMSNSIPHFTDCVFAGNTGIAISAGFGCVTCENCTFYDNSNAGSGVVELNQSGGRFYDCTFSGNSADSGAIYCWAHELDLRFENTIVAYTMEGSGIHCSPGVYSTNLTVTCCDIYGNAGGDWIGYIADLEDTLGNFSECPAFCDAGSGDLHLCDQSPCLPGNHPYGYACETIGAWGEGCSCGPTRTESATWGAIKAMYR
jgi:hypothetical protein